MSQFLYLSILLLFHASSFGQVTDGLVGHWPFDGDANDMSGNSNHGTVYGATLAADRFGRPDKAYCFDGIDDYIVTAFSGISGNSARSISFWALISADGNPVNSDGTEVITYGDTPATGPGNSFRVTLNRACSGMGAGLGESTYTLDSSMPSLSDWHFFTLIYDASVSEELGDFSYYVDGELLPNTYCDSYNTSITVNTSTTIPIHFGRLYLASQPRWFTGCLDDIRMYDRVLEQWEIDELYNESDLSNSIDHYQTEFEINIYPNPATSELHIDAKKGEISTMQIIGIDGKVVLNKSFSKTIDVSDFSNGFYTILFYDADGELVVSNRFVKSNT